MPSVADQLRAESRREERAFFPAQRYERALLLGDVALEAFHAARGCDRETALTELERRRPRGRRPSRVAVGA